MTDLIFPKDFVFAVYNFADNTGKGIGPTLGGLVLAGAS